MTVINRTMTIESTTCGNCGILFGLESAFMQNRRDDGLQFYCPNGHFIHWGTGPEIQRLRDELERSQRAAIHAREQRDIERTRAESAERSAAAHKGVATKVRNRSQNGVCVVAGCKRHFTNLERHMKTCHPESADRTEAK